MKFFVGFLIAYIYTFGGIGSAEEKSNAPIAVNMVELIANPEKFASKVVVVRGFLIIRQEPHHGAESFLYLHEEDAKNLLYNGVLIIASEKIVKDQEKLDMQYVLLTGTVSVAAGANGSHSVQIRDIQNCVLWSNPVRPIGGTSKTHEEGHP